MKSLRLKIMIFCAVIIVAICAVVVINNSDQSSKTTKDSSGKIVNNTSKAIEEESFQNSNSIVDEKSSSSKNNSSEEELIEGISSENNGNEEDDIILNKDSSKNNSSTITKNENSKKNNSSKANDNSSSENSKKEETKSDSTITYKEFVKNYLGRWYLSGYSDVYLDITKLSEYDGIEIQATGITLPISSCGVVLYPFRNPSQGSYHGTNISAECWDDDLASNGLAVGNGCVFLSSYTFVRQQGTKDKYDGSFCKEALGMWYLKNNPNVTIQIEVIGGNENDGDLYGVSTTNFNFATHENNVNDYATITAAKDSDWEKLGISVSNGILTASNSNGTKTFYSYKTEIPKEETSSAIGNENNSSFQEPDVPETIPVSGIEISETSINMVVGEIKQLSANVLPANATCKEIIWSSDNTAIVQVDSTGGVTAVGKGTANITVSTAEGNYSAICVVSVSEPELLVSASMGVGVYMSSGSSVQGVFTEAIASGGSGNYVEYNIKVYFNGALVAEGTNSQVIVSLANGTYTSEVYVKDSSGNEAYATGACAVSGH